MTPGCQRSTWLCCCSSFNCSACGYGTLTCSLDVLPCPGPAVFDSPSLSRTCCLNLWILSYEKPTDIYSWGTVLLHPLQLLWLLLDSSGHLWTFEHLEEQSGLNGHVLLYSPPGTARRGPPLWAWFLSRSLLRFLPFLGVFPSHHASTSALLAVWVLGCVSV